MSAEQPLKHKQAFVIWETATRDKWHREALPKSHLFWFCSIYAFLWRIGSLINIQSVSLTVWESAGDGWLLQTLASLWMLNGLAPDTYIIYCTNRECITWQVGAIIFLDLFGLQLKKQKTKKQNLVISWKISLFHYYKHPSKTEKCLQLFHLCSLSWLIHWLFFLFLKHRTVREWAKLPAKIYGLI